MIVLNEVMFKSQSHHFAFVKALPECAARIFPDAGFEQECILQWGLDPSHVSEHLFLDDVAQII